MKLFAKHSWSKWEDVSLITSNGYWKLLQVSECSLTGRKKFKQRRLGWVNEPGRFVEIKNKLNL